MTIKETHADSKVSISCQVIPYGIPRMQYWHCNPQEATCIMLAETRLLLQTSAKHACFVKACYRECRWTDHVLLAQQLLQIEQQLPPVLHNAPLLVH